MRTARALDAHPLTRDALATGRVNLDQATEILKAVDDLPDTVGTGDRERAERHLLGEARQHDAKVLRRLGAHLLEVLDPDAADQALADKLEREERRAARKTFLELRDRGDGTHDGQFRLGTLHRAMLERYLGSLLNPDLPDPIDRDGKTRPEQLGEAFTRFLERYPSKKLPKSGGVNATVVVTMTLETLFGGLQAASLDTGELISASMARRLACAAGVIPAVLGSDSEVLDLGRKVRLHTPKQRLAMSIQQHGSCAVEDCQRPTWWGDGHHLISWSAGGDTSVEDGVLICPRHHTLAHQTRFRLERQGPGHVRLVRRQ